MHTLVHRLRFPLAAVLIIANIFLISLIPSILKSAQHGNTSQTVSASSSQPTSFSDNPNVVTNGLNDLTATLSRTISSAGNNASNAFGSVFGGIGRGIATAFFGTGHVIGTVFHGVATGVTFGVAHVFGFIAGIPGAISDAVIHGTLLSAVVRPSDKSNVPTISNTPPAPSSTQANAVAAPVQPTPTPDTQPAWPIHGMITTLFGVPEPPYEPIHTGIDISDGRAPGVTPIHPFKPGTVVQVVHSNLGLGNHIVIDHGGGMTSVYGHLNSTSVSVGQQVDKNTVLGFEGTTGASTGPHLHFEIRINGQAVNPQLYIAGHP